MPYTQPIGGLYRKMVVGLEQSHRTSFMNGHLMWQDRLHKEQTARDKANKSWYNQMGDHAPVPIDARGVTPCADGVPSRLPTRIAADRMLWHDTPGPGSREPDLDTVAGRLEAERRGRLKLSATRGLAASLSDSALRNAKAQRSLRTGTDRDWALDVASSGGDPGKNQIIAELPLRNHEISARQWRALRVS
eukprot:TRINITY_DN38163_c0_g1_i1.p1 TRINITY_DN38163_c0_g1~~TRINITY_DN38163_c0_g1_i1.p1  ORF type:complete len:191 (-),score=27.43 TRINITY_DN38163_c0_g1_i1:41-613(-)